MRFYFTYGSEGQDYYGGWTVVEAPNINAAIAAFNAFHKPKGEFINCSSIYLETDIKQSNMWKNGNFGQFCHETISLTRDEVN